MNTTAPKPHKMSYFMIFDLFSLGFIGGVALYFTGFEKLAVLAWLPTFIFGVMSIFKKRDEFAATCWHSATSAAFGFLLIGLIAIPFAQGMVDGLVEGFTDKPYSSGDYTRQISGEGAILIQIAIVIIVFQYKRFRGLVG